MPNMTSAPRATPISRASTETSICSEAYLSRKATPKNNTMTPKRTNVLPPKKKFQSADVCARAGGNARGKDSGSGARGADGRDEGSEGSDGSSISNDEPASTGAPAISVEGGGVMIGVVVVGSGRSSVFAAAPSVVRDAALLSSIALTRSLKWRMIVSSLA